MVRNALAGPKNNHMLQNEMGMGKYSLRYHTHTFSWLCTRKMIKETQLNFEKGCFLGLNCLTIRRPRNTPEEISVWQSDAALCNISALFAKSSVILMPFFEDSKHCAEILNYTLETQRRIQNDVSSVCLYVTVIYHQNEI